MPTCGVFVFLSRGGNHPGKYFLNSSCADMLDKRLAPDLRFMGGN